MSELFKAYGFYDNKGKLIHVVPSTDIEEAKTWFEENFPDVEYLYVEVLRRDKEC